MRKRAIGYSYWGFLGDDKYNMHGDKLSTPDGNAFYSWSIISEFQRRQYDVIQVMPDRDFPGFVMNNTKLFSSWCTSKRYFAYDKMVKSSDDKFLDYEHASTLWDSKLIWDVWRSMGLHECQFIIHEWRMEIPGRNDLASKDKVEGWQPDLLLQNELVTFCRTYDIPLVVFDLDYKLEEKVVREILESGVNLRIIELGTKWNKLPGIYAQQVEIPFDFSSIDTFDVIDTKYCNKGLTYVGNRYERDWCVYKYINPHTSKSKPMHATFYGNWKEAGRDSAVRWPYIDFKPRVQLSEMHDVYSHSVATILMAKEDYCDNGFMTARIIEAVFYGTLPIFISEFGEETIHKYAGGVADILTVRDFNEVDDIVRTYRRKSNDRKQIISYLRKYLNFMDVSNFVERVIGLVG